MRSKLMLKSLIYSFLLVSLTTMIGLAFADDVLGDLGFLLAPGIWTVYDLFDVSSLDALPFLAAQLINILVYWLLFVLLLGLLRKSRRERAKPGAPIDRPSIVRS
jgi:hypothetical protein